MVTTAAAYDNSLSCSKTTATGIPHSCSAGRLIDAALPTGRGHGPLPSLELWRPLFDKGLGGLPKILREVQPQAAGVIGALLFHAAGEPA
jgi:hypothetical protein